MPNALVSNIKQTFSTERLRYIAACLWQEIAGLAEDYWKDGHWEKADENDDLGDTASHSPSGKTSLKDRLKHSPFAPKTIKGVWHAEPGEISEKIWGDGFVTPGDEYVAARLIRPLGLNKDMNLLDLSAGLGGRLRKVTEEFGIYISGLEPDPQIAERGMMQSIAMGQGKHVTVAPYDPKNLVVDRNYDCVMMRETLYRVPDKNAFIKSIGEACKPRAQVSFTDYIVDPENRDKPAIIAWRAFEKNADPVGLVEMTTLWAKIGIELRVHDDMTDYYREEVKKGLARFAQFMASGVTPDKETKLAIQKRITTWALRMAAIDQGMRFYRFYGLR